MPRKKPGARPGVKLTQEHRDKIAKSNILARLVKHANGEVDMSATQVTAALALIKKYLPDQQAMDITSLGEGVQLPSVIELVAKHDDSDS